MSKRDTGMVATLVFMFLAWTGLLGKMIFGFALAVSDLGVLLGRMLAWLF